MGFGGWCWHIATRAFQTDKTGEGRLAEMTLPSGWGLRTQVAGPTPPVR